METDPEFGGTSRRLLIAVASLVLGVGVFLWLSPGGLGDGEPVWVVGGASVDGYQSITEWVADTPSWFGHSLEIATEGTLVLLGLILLWVWWTALRAGNAARAAGAIVVGFGMLAAYGLSETLKVLIEEERPCRAVPGANALAECPPVGDWSFPSNHSTLAVALGVGLAVLLPRLAAVTLPLAALGALLRVAVGVHYPHDVLAGATLGAAVVTAVLVLLGPPAVRPTATVFRRWLGHQPGSGGQHRRGGPVPPPPPRQDLVAPGAEGAHQPAGDARFGQPFGEAGQQQPVPGGAQVGGQPHALGGQPGDHPRRDHG
ncbi:phosphatase PAP2 family protein [Streptomyces sp. DSM 44915]|uniref:Phosphatase PAP2 family protein n=1 Tax=Streptomyces chisholmiae TaxID=3075540 RepID=A0ABU2JRJ7_9ACTN|nr:phosphatase PAP2 family protein [Streptomyces sp. DSM 44915]MDT0267582.1 phosphatase PAP2 family protein [Streptomyces sp. DSM 44915]